MARLEPLVSEAPVAPGPGGGGKKLFGLPRNVVIIGGVAFAGTILYLWYKSRNSAAAAGATQAASTTGTGTDDSGQLAALQSEIEQLQQAGAGSSGGGSSGGGGGGWDGGYGTGSGSWDGNGQNSYDNSGSGSSTSSGGSASTTPASGGSTSTTTTPASGGSASTTTTAPGSAAPAAPTGGHASKVTNNGAVVGWNANGASRWSVRIVGPGPINGFTNTVTIPQATYSGLSAGHNYEVYVTPLSATGVKGPTGVVTFQTTK